MNAPEESIEHRLGRIETLLQNLEQLAAPSAGATARELVTLLLEMHGAALTRMLELLGEGRQPLLETWTRDALIAGVLLLHGLHPVPLETRVLQAIVAVRPNLQAHGADVELLEVVEGVVRLRYREQEAGAPRLLRTILEQVLGEAAPDARAIEWEGIRAPEAGRLSLPLIGSPF